MVEELRRSIRNPALDAPADLSNPAPTTRLSGDPGLKE
jgi:hypothetical protein